MPVKQWSCKDLVWSALILVLVVVGLIAFGRSSAQAAAVNCGDTITTDTTLHQDLVDCPNNVIIIGADNVTLDLNSHLVDGDGTEFAGCDPNAAICDSGVVNDGHDGVTVMHGRVREFGVGVLLGTTTPGRVRHNRLLDISSSKNLSFGFEVASTARSVVRESSGSNNVAPEGDGMGLFDAHHVRVLHNSFRHNPGPNIHVGDSSDNVIKENLIARNRGIAMLLEQADRNRVGGNRFVRNGSSVVVAPGNHRFRHARPFFGSLATSFSRISTAPAASLACRRAMAAGSVGGGASCASTAQRQRARGQRLATTTGHRATP